ncbi:MAG: 23S rRNA pseudouridine synthase [Spirochaetes bacterium]|nr:MAG: 23S rRNA pseudouridine synthase [Spirochaetota bacterium]
MGKPYEIIYADEDILLVNKMGALSVQKDKSGDQDLQSILSQDFPSPAGFLEASHRIDRRTSGLVLFARTKFALAQLERDFQDRKIEKTYLACLEKEPIPSEGELVHRIVHDQRRNLTLARPEASSESGRGKFKHAALKYRLLLRTDRYFFVEVAPKTGRHHQIRAQFAALGCPIKGDLKYGARRSCLSGRIMLHAWRIGFTHPGTGHPMSFSAPIPKDETLWQVLEEGLTSAPLLIGDINTTEPA